MATGALVLVGWIFGVEALVRIHPDYNPMRFNTALCLVASGGGVWLIATRNLKWQRILARLLGGVVLATALLTLAEHVFGWEFHIDQLLWHDTFSSSQPGRMVPLTAIFLVWTGIFLLLSASERSALILTGQIAGILANLTAQGAVLDLIFRSNKEEGAASHTAAAVFALSIGMLLVPRRRSILAPLTNTSAGGRMIRSLIPIATLVPPLAGWVYLEATRSGLFPRGAGFVIVVLLYSASLLLVTIWTANSIDGVDLRLAAIIDSSDDAIFSEAIDGTIISWNPGAERLFGYAASEVTARSILILVPPDRHREWQDLLRRVWQGESANQFETVRVCKDGTQIDVSLTLSPVKNARGEVTAVSVVAQNITLRKEAEKKSKSASLYTRSLIEASLDPLVTISLAGKITDVNKATEMVTGITRERLIGTDFSDYFTEPEKAREGYRQAFAEGTVHDYPLAIRSMSGVVTEVLYNASVFRNQAGEVEGVFAAARDVTERNQGEAKLRSASLYTRSLIEASPDPLVTISREGKITDVNEATERVTGVARKQLIGTDFSDYFTEPEDARQGYQRVFAEGSVHNYPLAIRSTSGVITDVLYNASVFRNEAGEVEGVFAAARDVTERNRIEAARIQANKELRELNQELESRVDARTRELKDSEQRVRRKLESILSPKGDLEHFELSDIMDLGAVQSLAEKLYKLTSLPFFLLDLEGNVQVEVGWQSACRDFHRVHPEACKNCRESDGQLSTGVSAGEFKLYKCKNQMWDVVTPIILGDRHIGNLFSGQFFFDDEETDFALFQQQAKKFGFDEKDYLAALHRVPRLDREQVMTGMAFYAKLTNLLTNLGYSGIKLGQAMAETNNVNAKLADSVKELESFAYSVSHDLRAPLRHIDGFLTLLSTKTYSTLDDSSKHYVDRTLLASKRMGELIDDLLRFSRIGRSEIRKMPVDLNVVIQEILRELEPEIGKRKIDWQLTPLPKVVADRAMLLQVVENLLANALKFTRNHETAKIEVGFKPEPNGQLVFFVRDNGAGFDMRYYDKLFQVFQRLHGEQEFEGTGIGLAIARSVVERHGGRIWAEGSVGQGATFYFSLPAEGRQGEINELAEAHLAG